jgi:hypothetical protein
MAKKSEKAWEEVHKDGTPQFHVRGNGITDNVYYDLSVDWLEWKNKDSQLYISLKSPEWDCEGGDVYLNPDSTKALYKFLKKVLKK